MREECFSCLCHLCDADESPDWLLTPLSQAAEIFLLSNINGFSKQAGSFSLMMREIEISSERRRHDCENPCKEKLHQPSGERGRWLITATVAWSRWSLHGRGHNSGGSTLPLIKFTLLHLACETQRAWLKRHLRFGAILTNTLSFLSNVGVIFPPFGFLVLVFDAVATTGC